MNVNRAAGTNLHPAQTNQLQERDTKQNKHAGHKEAKDEFVPSQQVENKTYQKPKVDRATIKRLQAESERNYAQLREMVRKLLARQGLTFKDLTGLEVVEVDAETRMQAREMIGEGGPLSPERVSDNIVDFAKAVSGGDKNKIALLKEAIEEGFREAARMLGGELPEISHKTHELVMQKLDEWEKE